MAFEIIREDLTRVAADAVVVPSNTRLMPDGGVAYDVAKAAGYRRVRRACARLGGCAVGKAAATPAFDLNAEHIIHAVCPAWQGGGAGEAQLLRSAYDSALQLAVRLNAQSVAMPLLSAGTYGYPVREAFEIAVAATRDFLAANDMDVLLVVFDKRAVTEGSRLFGQVTEYIDDTYVDEHDDVLHRYLRDRSIRGREGLRLRCPTCGTDCYDGAAFCTRCGTPLRRHRDYGVAPEDASPLREAGSAADFGEVGISLSVDEARTEPLVAGSPAPTAASPRPSFHLPTFGGGRAKERRADASASMPAPAAAEADAAPDLGTLLAHMDDSFSAMLMQLIDARGLTDAQVYKRANISRQHFSKMRNPSYRPTKRTVVALAVALELSLDDTRELLARAGFALTHSSKFDIIVEYFIRQGNYDTFAINETLFAYDQPILG